MIYSPSIDIIISLALIPARNAGVPSIGDTTTISKAGATGQLGKVRIVQLGATDPAIGAGGGTGAAGPGGDPVVEEQQ